MTHPAVIAWLADTLQAKAVDIDILSYALMLLIIRTEEPNTHLVRIELSEEPI
jgi:hypothetical protein